jgi:ASC-1-like (ASCH) protein
MEMTDHVLKLNQRYFDAVENGIKTFEVRRNDRDYKVGDRLMLTDVDDEGNPIYNTGLSRLPRFVFAEVTYILTHDDFPDGVPEGYVVMSIKAV